MIPTKSRSCLVFANAAKDSITFKQIAVVEHSDQHGSILLPKIQGVKLDPVLPASATSTGMIDGEKWQEIVSYAGIQSVNAPRIEMTLDEVVSHPVWEDMNETQRVQHTGPIMSIDFKMSALNYYNNRFGGHVGNPSSGAVVPTVQPKAVQLG